MQLLSLVYKMQLIEYVIHSIEVLSETLLIRLQVIGEE